MSAHSSMQTKVYIKKERTHKVIFIVIVDKEHSNIIEDHYSNYIKHRNFTENYDETKRKIQLDSLLCGKSYSYKSLQDTKEENDNIAEIAEHAYTKFLTLISPSGNSFHSLYKISFK